MEYGPEDVAAVFGRAANVYDTVIPFFARFGARLVELADLRPGESVSTWVQGGARRSFLPRAGSGRTVGRSASTWLMRWSGF